jgi:uncharacterized membrane protein YvbJ
MKYCPECGKEMAQGTNTCIYCRYSDGPSKPERLYQNKIKRKEELRQNMAVMMGFLIFIMAFLLSLQRNPDTGDLTFNITILFLGTVLAVIVFGLIVFSGKQDKFFRLRFCVSCGRSIPFDAVICPYCRYDYEKNLKTREFPDNDSLGQDSDVKGKV